MGLFFGFAFSGVGEAPVNTVSVFLTGKPKCGVGSSV